MVIVLMGVAGAGKTTVGSRLADELSWQFCDGDSLHSWENIDKMKRGIPLNDEDRRSWLEEIRKVISGWVERDANAILACSLLKQSYRKSVLEGHHRSVRVVFLKADKLLLQERLANRTGHFLNSGLLDSQLSTLEEPDDALMLDASDAPEHLVKQIRLAFHL